MAERFEATAPDGIALSATVTGGDAAGTPLLLVHGTSGDAARWGPVLPGLAAGRPVYALDRRGRGGSGDADGPYSIALEFEDVRAMCAAIAARHGGRIDLLGHSYGGICSIEAVVRGIPALHRFVLYEPPIPLGDPFIDFDLIEEMNGLLAAGDRAKVVEAFVLRQVGAPEAELNMMKRDPSWANRVDAAHTIPRELSSIGRGLAPSFDGYAGIAVPTRLLLGTESSSYLKAASHRLAELIPGSELILLDGHAHNAMNTGPALFVKRVVEFLEG